MKIGPAVLLHRHEANLMSPGGRWTSSSFWEKGTRFEICDFFLYLNQCHSADAVARLRGDPQRWVLLNLNDSNVHCFSPLELLAEVAG